MSSAGDSKIFDITDRPTRNREYERKYRLGTGSGEAHLIAEFIGRLAPWLLQHSGRVQRAFFNGLDEYFSNDRLQIIARYRRNMLRDEVTFKSLGGDIEDRQEVPWKVYGTTPEQIRAGLVMNGYAPDVIVNQSGYVCVLPNEVEIVVYSTKLVDGSGEQLFIEIEALNPRDPAEALATIARYEQMLAIDPATQVKRSIFEMYRLSRNGG